MRSSLVAVSKKLFKLSIQRQKCFLANRIHHEEERNNNEEGETHNSQIPILLSTLGFCALGFAYSSMQALKAKDEKEFTLQDIAKHSSPENGVWVTYQGKVYDITKFMDIHPGGSVIALAAGKDIAPFWETYNIHTASDLASKMLEEYRIGTLKSSEKLSPCMMGSGKPVDDYDLKIQRNPAIVVLSRKPFNAEPPSHFLADTFLTPQDLMFVRSHIHTPKADPEQWKLEVTGMGLTKPAVFSLQDLKNPKKFPPVTVMAAMQCAGNRRETLAAVSKPNSPLAFRHSVLSNGNYKGVPVVEVLRQAGFDLEKAKAAGAKHVIFEGQDHNGVEPFSSSIPLHKALDPDTILSYQINGEDLLPDHGYPLRGMVPGYAGQRSVKWLRKIMISPIESQSFWQQKDKILPPWNPKPENNPAFMELPIQSAICDPGNDTRVEQSAKDITVKGYAWSGGGRGIMRVDITTDGGKSWTPAELQRPDQPEDRVWAWSQWKVTLPLPEVTGYEKRMKVCSKAVDMAYNVQPESPISLINDRGFGCNSWHCVDIIRPPKKL